MSNLHLLTTTNMLKPASYSVVDAFPYSGYEVFWDAADYFSAFEVIDGYLQEFQFGRGDELRIFMNEIWLPQPDRVIENAGRGNFLKWLPVALTNADVIIGSKGNDGIAGYGSGDTLIGNGGHDLIDGGEGHDVIAGVTGNDTVLGGAGMDEIIVGKGHDLIDGGPDFDTLTFANVDDVRIDLSKAGRQRLSETASVTVSRIEDVNGTSGDDRITGNTRFNMLYGRDGRDTLSGGSGNDTLNGDDGRDTLTGGIGNDTFVMSGDNDRDIIRDFGVGTDVINVGAWGVYDFADLKLRDLGRDIVVSYQGRSLVLDDLRTISAVDALDFTF